MNPNPGNNNQSNSPNNITFFVDQEIINNNFDNIINNYLNESNQELINNNLINPNFNNISSERIVDKNNSEYPIAANIS
jgi:hypothetical protein